ncbi:MAG TPA: hypothetical protein VIF12_01475 [Micavibrio sp.]|jgi:hypothetical protein
MTTDFLSGATEQTVSSTMQAGVPAPAAIAAGPVKSSKRALTAGREDALASPLQRSLLEIEGLNRKISAVVAHLTQACAMLEVADAGSPDRNPVFRPLRISPQPTI